MKDGAAATQQGTEAPRVEKIYMENTLLRIAGALFCHDQKRAASRTEQMELNRGVEGKTIVIRPDARLGQPGPLAHKIFVALIKKHSDYGRPIRDQISFTRREIGRLIGRKEWGGRDSEQLARALHEIHYTFINTNFRNRDGKHVQHSFNIFPEIWIERREFASDPIERCTVTLATPIVESLQDDHFTCLNHALMQQLGTIGQALYIRLFFHFSNLYDGKSGNRLAFPKRYDDICAEWLGGLTVLQHKSKIVSDQLGAHLDQLVGSGFLGSYSIEKAKTAAGFVITFRPGRQFFDDYDRFYRRRHQAELQFDFHADRKDIGEPLRVAYLFAEKRSGQPVTSIAFVPSKDVETAKQFLAELPFEEMGAFIAYGLAEASKTNFDVQTLGGIKQYLGGYVAHKSQAEVRRRHEAADRARQQAEAEEHAYDLYRSAEADRIFGGLPAEDQVEIVALATQQAGAFTGSLKAQMIAYKTRRIVAERHPEMVGSFEQWRSERKAA